jgi:hypothetical protein
VLGHDRELSLQISSAIVQLQVTALGKRGYDIAGRNSRSPGTGAMIIAVVQIPMPRRPREAAIAAQTKSAPTFRALAGKGLLRKDYLNGDAGGGGVYYWTSREAAEAWYTPEWRRQAKATFGAEPVITYYETYVTVDNVKGETIVREDK